MVTKGFKQLLDEANAVVEAVSVQEALGLLDDEDVVFIDVREGEERARGAIPDSIHAPRGFLEMIADPAGPAHNPAFASGKKLVLYCGSGGRSALAGRTLAEMGLGNVFNLVGGIQAWSQAGGPIER